MRYVSFENTNGDIVRVNPSLITVMISDKMDGEDVTKIWFSREHFVLVKGGMEDTEQALS